MHVRAHRPAHHLAAEQIDHHGQEQPAFLGRDRGDIATPRLIGCPRSEVAVQKVRRDRQIMPARTAPISALNEHGKAHRGAVPFFE